MRSLIVTTVLTAMLATAAIAQPKFFNNIEGGLNLTNLNGSFNSNHGIGVQIGTTQTENFNGIPVDINLSLVNRNTSFSISGFGTTIKSEYSRTLIEAQARFKHHIENHTLFAGPYLGVTLLQNSTVSSSGYNVSASDAFNLLDGGLIFGYKTKLQDMDAGITYQLGLLNVANGGSQRTGGFSVFVGKTL